MSFKISLSVLSIRLCTFLTSSDGGRFSGFTPLLSRILRTSLLLSTCSFVIALSSDNFVYYIVTSQFSSKILSLYYINRVGRKSAKGLLEGTPSWFFMNWVVLPPNNALSPSDRIKAKLRLSTPRS